MLPLLHAQPDVAEPSSAAALLSAEAATGFSFSSTFSFDDAGDGFKSPLAASGTASSGREAPSVPFPPISLSCVGQSRLIF